MAGLHLAAHTFGILYSLGIEEALNALADAGFRTVELAATPPHVSAQGPDQADRKRVRRALRGAGLACCSVTPTFGDLNLASLDADLRALSVRRVQASIEFAAEVGAKVVVIIPGRRHPLVPAPAETVATLFERSLEELLPTAAEHGVLIGVENFAAGVADTGADLARLADRYGKGVGVVYDVANGLVVEDPVAGIRAAAQRLCLVHLSDSTRQRWTHGRIGAGEIDFAAVSATLRETEFRGISVYELLESDDVATVIGPDALKLEALGWTLGTKDS